MPVVRLGVGGRITLPAAIGYSLAASRTSTLSVTRHGAILFLRPLPAAPLPATQPALTGPEIRLGTRGRITIPAHLRSELGLATGARGAIRRNGAGFVLHFHPIAVPAVPSPGIGSRAFQIKYLQSIVQRAVRSPSNCMQGGSPVPSSEVAQATTGRILVGLLSAAYQTDLVAARAVLDRFGRRVRLSVVVARRGKGRELIVRAWQLRDRSRVFVHGRAFGRLYHLDSTGLGVGCLEDSPEAVGAALRSPPHHQLLAAYVRCRGGLPPLAPDLRLLALESECRAVREAAIGGLSDPRPARLDDRKGNPSAGPRGNRPHPLEGEAPA
jgi:hypothetical protein